MSNSSFEDNFGAVIIISIALLLLAGILTLSILDPIFGVAVGIVIAFFLVMALIAYVITKIDKRKGGL